MDPYEGGVRVPAIFSDPRLPLRTRGTKRDFLMHISDWFLTFPNLANKSFVVDGYVDGFSQLSNLGAHYSSADKYNVRKESLIVLTDINNVYNSACSNTNAAYRYMDWKLIYGETYRVEPDGLYTKPAENEDTPDLTGDSCLREEAGRTVIRCLFNVAEDPSEQRNLYDKHPDIVNMLLSKVNHYDKIRKEPVLTHVYSPTEKNTVMIGQFRTPSFNHCSGPVDFPLRPQRKRYCPLLAST